MLVLRGLKPPLKPDTPDSYHVLRNLDPPLPQQVRQKTKELLVDEELRKRRVNKMTMIAEGADAAKREQEAQQRKRKLEADKSWEDTREDRVKGWRSFQGGANKKKKAHKALG